MRDLRDILDNALGSPECEDCPHYVRRIEHCNVPQHQGEYVETECNLAESGGDPNECPVVVSYKVDYAAALEEATRDIACYLDPHDAQLGKHLAALIADEDTLDAALTLKAYLLKIAAQVAEENV